MVWHAHMLNPRRFLEDTMRYGLRQFWHTGMPWLVVNNAIDTQCNYNTSDECKARWIQLTGHAWDNPDDPKTKSLACPACSSQLQIPWTTCGRAENYKGT